MNVLLRYHNDYNQHGGYFVAVFQGMPTLAEVAKALELDAETPGLFELVQHIMNGGGRRDNEDVWYELNEVTPLGGPSPDLLQALDIITNLTERLAKSNAEVHSQILELHRLRMDRLRRGPRERCRVCGARDRYEYCQRQNCPKELT